MLSPSIVPVRRRGFTLVEIMLVVIIIGLLMSIAIPTFLRIREHSFASRLANDYSTFRKAFEVYYLENGGWPNDTTHGVLPPEMQGYLTGFAEPVLTGDHWDWDRNAVGAVAGVSLRGGMTPTSIMEKVDRILDDGDLSSGRIYVNGNRYTFELW